MALEEQNILCLCGERTLKISGFGIKEDTWCRGCMISATMCQCPKPAEQEGVIQS